ncbi:adenine deaminase [Chloroflexota bacterium]
MSITQIISAGTGRSPADVVLANCRVINTFNGQLEEADVAISNGVIAGVGAYRDGHDIVDLEGQYLAPGLIDGHIHIESSMLHPVEYVRTVVPRGVLGVVTDLHEIANVGGLEAVKLMMQWCEGLPCDFFFMLPSCVPASPLETSGNIIAVNDLKKARRWRNTIGLGEVMNFPGVVNMDDEMLAKIQLFRERVVDGHAPRLSGKELNAYVASGIRSDHECTRLEEASEKLARGLYVMIREGSSEKNLDELLPLVCDNTYKRCMFVVDDRSCVDLQMDGDVDAVVRLAITKGLDPIRAIQMATINPAEYFRLYAYGAIAPGYVANLMAMKDLNSSKATIVFHRGRVVARNGELITHLPGIASDNLAKTVRIKPIPKESLILHSKKDTFPVIEVVPGQIVTRKRVETVNKNGDIVLPDVEQDILKLVVIERHKYTGNIGLGLIKGIGLKKGALGSSIAHDSHNIVIAGCNDEDILLTIREIERLQGGLVVCAEGKVVASLPLPIAGLLSDKPLNEVVEGYRKVQEAALGLGTIVQAPFSVLSFMALPVIPELKLTDLGLVDVCEFRLLEFADIG